MAGTISEQRQEELLQSWIDMSLRIRGNRLVSGFSFNEIVICRILYTEQLQGGSPVTAADLCRRMQLLKSQINKILTSMEKRELIERVRSESDRRVVNIVILDEGRRRLQQIQGALNEHVAGWQHALTGEEFVRLENALYDIIEILGKI